MSLTPNPFPTVNGHASQQRRSGKHLVFMLRFSYLRCGYRDVVCVEKAEGTGQDVGKDWQS